MKSNITGTSRNLQIGSGPRIVGDTDNFVRIKNPSDEILANTQVGISKADTFLSQNIKYTNIQTVVDNELSLSDGIGFKTGETNFVSYSSSLTDVNPVSIIIPDINALTSVCNLKVSLGELGAIVNTVTSCISFQGNLALFQKTLQDTFNDLGLGFSVAFNTDTYEITLTQSTESLYIYEFSLYNGVYNSKITMNVDGTLNVSGGIKDLVLTGNSTAITQDIADSSSKIATTQYVTALADTISASLMQPTKNYYLGLDDTDTVLYDTAPVTEQLVPFAIVPGATTTKEFIYDITSEIILSPASSYYFWLWVTAGSNNTVYTLTGELYYFDDESNRVDIATSSISVIGTGNATNMMIPMGNSLLTETTRLEVGSQLYLAMSVSSDKASSETISVYTGGSTPSYLVRNGTEILANYVIGTYKGESHTQEYINANKQDKAPPLTSITATSGTVPLETANFYTMTMSGDTVFTLTSITGEALNDYQEIRMLLNVTSVPTSINWGTTAHNITLSTGYFEVTWKYNPLRSMWVCSAIKED